MRFQSELDELQIKQNSQSLGQFFDPLLQFQLVLGMTSFGLDNCLNSFWHAFYKILACFWSDSIPLFCHSLPQLMHSLWWRWISVHLPLQGHSQVFNGVDVRRLGRPG